MIRDILLLGEPALYERCSEVTDSDMSNLKAWIDDLHDTLMEYRRVRGAGRAISAPQIGVGKRLIYMFIDSPKVFVNPVLSFPDDGMFEVMDDCMSFPGLCVRVLRHRNAVIDYLDENMNECRMVLKDDLSELLQHECDHLDGILATMRAIDDRSFFFMDMKRQPCTESTKKDRKR